MNELFDYGYDPHFYGLPAEGEISARVISVQRDLYGVVCVRGEGRARLKSSAYRTEHNAVYPTIGDFVSLRWNDSGDSIITRTMPRKSYFARSDSFSARGTQAIAANVDYALLISSLNRDFNLRRLERYLVQTLESGAAPVFMLTKADLCPDPTVYISQLRAIAPEVPVHAVSAHTGFGMDELAPYLSAGATLVMLGMSGVGKSSLLNALMGYERMAVNRTRDIDPAKGRHTTTHRELIRLPTGALLIDTPGMRELGVWDAQDGVMQAFADIDALAAQCRFSDCTHTREPGCAVQAALASGALNPRRYKNYLDLLSQAKQTARIAAKRRGR